MFIILKFCVRYSLTNRVWSFPPQISHHHAGLTFSANVTVFRFYTLLINFCRATACNATHGIAVAILSVRPSVRPSIRCVYCDKWCTADILIPHETAITLVLWHQHYSGWWATPPSLWNIRWKWPTSFVKRRLRDINKSCSVQGRPDV